jgi:hypothetical protein
MQQLRRADTTWSDDTGLANIKYNDKYVVVYNFSETGSYHRREHDSLRLIV